MEAYSDEKHGLRRNDGCRQYVNASRIYGYGM